MKPRVRLQNLPLDTLRKCRAAAKEAKWTLTEWDDFKDEASGWLQPGAEDIEEARFEDVVRSRFDVQS